MKIKLPQIARLLCLYGVIAVGLAGSLHAQIMVSTNHVVNNGSGMVVFNVQNTNANAMILTEVHSATYTAGTFAT